MRVFVVNQQSGAYDVGQDGTRARMSTKKKIYFDKEASPLARVFCNTIRLATQKPAGQAIIENMAACFSLKSSKGPRAITIDISRDSVRLSDGVSPQSSIVIEMNFDNPAEKPKIRGAWKHPCVTYKISQLLSLPLPNWADSAKRFWAATSDLPNMPGQLTVTCIDEDRSLSFGDGSTSFEILGTASQLETLLIGQSLLVAEAMGGNVRIRGSLEHLAGLSGAGQKLMLGELDG